MPRDSYIREQNTQITYQKRRESPRVFKASILNLSDWLNTLFLFLALGTAIWSVEQAKWIKPTPSFIAIFAIAILISFFLSKSRLPSLASHLVALVIGLAVIFWQSVIILPEASLATKVWRLINDVQTWLHAGTYGAPIPVTIHITLMFGYLTWLIGYFSEWLLVKKRSPWLAVLLGTIVILVNLNFGNSEKYFHFLIFAAVSLVFIAVANFTRYYSLLPKNDVRQSRRGPKSWVVVSLCLIIITVSIAWTNPGFRIAAAADYAKANNPFKGNSMELFWQNFFATVPGSGAPSLIHGGQQNMLFGGSLELSEQVVFFIKSAQANYWKTQIYDYYDSNGWKTSSVSEKVTDERTISQNPTASSVFTQNVTIIPQVKTNVLPVFGEFAFSDVPVIEKILNPKLFEINLSSSAGDSLLPQDIASVAQSIRAGRFSRRFSSAQIEALLPAGLNLVSINRSGSTIQSISIGRNQPESSVIVALSASQAMLPQQRAMIYYQPPPNPTGEQLATAGVNYPATVTDRYLQLPSSLPSRVKDLAASITQGHDTPYAKAMAIKEALAQYPYSLVIETPPANADGVDYFLFTQKSGYCTYFASAMTVMLRSSGVPARMVSGFLPGQYDAQMQNYVIRDRDYHAWTEVYFPGYGWLIFDATPGGTASGGEITEPITEVPPIELSNLPDYTIDTSSINSNPGTYTNQILSGVFGLLVVLLLWFWIYFYRRSRDIQSIYSRMILLASLAGSKPKSWQTALEFSQQLSLDIPRQAPAIMVITEKYVYSRYGNSSQEISLDKQFDKMWSCLRKTLIKRCFHLK